MHIHDLPSEILTRILLLAAQANVAAGPTFSYGLGEVASLLEPHKAKPSKYVRGPLSPQDLRWHATSDLRQTCAAWHDWALGYALDSLVIQMWRGEQRWLELPRHIRQYGTYEIMEKHLGHVVWAPGHLSLERTDALLQRHPAVGAHVRRLVFNGLHLATTDRHILSIVARCPELKFLSVPWTVLRRGTPADWRALLKADTAHPLYSLELHSVNVRAYKAEALLQEMAAEHPLADPSVDFAQLKRLKIFGSTTAAPVGDADLALIARTATGLESLDITNNSTTTVAGMMALVHASRQTLQVLEHSPRSDDGFFHPFPGQLPDNAHLCTQIAALPRMRDLSLSVPHLCASFFANSAVHWSGECQVRFAGVCASPPSTPAAASLRAILAAARALIAERARARAQLSLELFYDGCIFDPAQRLVHGDFVMAAVRSNGQWPRAQVHSTRGPFGTSGVYGKDDSPWEAVHEEEYFRGVEQGWIQL